MYKSKNNMGIRDITHDDKQERDLLGRIPRPYPGPSSSRKSQMSGHTYPQKSTSVNGHPVLHPHWQIVAPHQSHRAGRTSARKAFVPSPVGSRSSPRMSFPSSSVRPRLPLRRIYWREKQVRSHKANLNRTLPSSLVTV